MPTVLDKSLLFSTIRATESFMTQVGKGTGWLPEPEDPRDYKLAQLIPNLKASSTVTQPMFVDLQGQSAVRDQGQVGSCTGFATTAAVEYLRRKPLEDVYETLYSPLFVYYNARATIGEELMDEGAYVRDAVKSVANIGASRERDWMYYEEYRMFSTKPNDRAYKSAKSWKVGGYYRCNGLADVKKALAAGFPVVGGFICFSNMNTQTVWNTGIIPLPSGSIQGGHAVCFVGYDDVKRLVKFKNSWGTYWGDDGYGYLPYEFFERMFADDLWVLEGESEETK